MSLNYTVAPGVILKEYIIAHGYNQKDFSRVVDTSAKHLSNIINGKAKLSEEFALKLESVFPDVKAEFWMDLEVSYRLFVLRIDKKIDANLSEISKRFQFKTVFSGLKLSLYQQSIEMLKILGINNYDEVDNLKRNLIYDYMEDGGNDDSILVWLKLCENEIDLQNDLERVAEFKVDELVAALPKFKLLLNSRNLSAVITNLRKFCNRLGIALVLHEALPNAKVRGATSMIDEKPAIFLSTRFKKLDTIYFAFVHELSHIISNSEFDIDYLITMDIENEEMQNEFAREFFIPNETYREFLLNNKDITEEAILLFSREINVIPDVIVGFLQHDGEIGYEKFNFLRQRIG